MYLQFAYYGSSEIGVSFSIHGEVSCDGTWKEKGEFCNIFSQRVPGAQASWTMCLHLCLQEEIKTGVNRPRN